jgi:hypothetical protein
MPLGHWNLQFLNHNSQRSYPLTETALKTDIDGAIRLPDSFIVALYLPLHAGLNISPEKFYIKSVLLASTGYNVTIGYDTGAVDFSTLTPAQKKTATKNNPDVATVNIARSTYKPNRTYALAGIDEFSDTIGQIVIGRLDEIDSLPPGLYYFEPAAGALETDAIRPIIRGISRLRVSNAGDLSEDIYGDVTLVAGRNMRIVVQSGVDGPQLTFSAISGLNLNTDCVCSVPETGECIRCINGVCSGGGGFTFVSGECVEVSVVDGGLKFTDICASPCCGCAELDALSAQVDRFSDGVNTLQNFITRLSSEVTQMSLVVLGSRLGDTGCTTCN